MHALMRGLPAYDQKSMFDTVLRDLARKFLQSGNAIMGDEDNLMRSEPAVSGVAALMNGLVQSNALLEEHVIHWLTSTNGEYAGVGLEARRAVIATLATSQGESPALFPMLHTDSPAAKLERILEKTLESFGNKLQIQHDAILQQECK